MTAVEPIPYEILTEPEGDFMVTIHPQPVQQGEPVARILSRHVDLTYPSGHRIRLENMPLDKLRRLRRSGELLVAEMNPSGPPEAYTARLTAQPPVKFHREDR